MEIFFFGYMSIANWTTFVLIRMWEDAMFF